ncbi:hypothetical protein [Leptospira stimsonii]|uniref:Restriction endonuclease n=1 Tax=Leptospira stimsonii TaxID=2202203 RepID=A0ABY2NAS7_9LEPT|nr:hypothetical protein [Leptospira stimsonii]TGK14295.1 hypothetical protein EHO98_17405 [Leptospira stimsonii]TGM20264.1 hypothetical protein EHQ90_03565 [Leptospira stimsonii]
MDRSIEDKEDLILDSKNLERELCVRTEIYRGGIALQSEGDNQNEISTFEGIILENLKEKGFRQIIFFKSKAPATCEFQLNYKKINYPGNLYLEFIIGFPIVANKEIELYATEYSKDQKLVRGKTIRNGYRHYISWLLLPTFFLFYRPNIDADIVDSFHSQFFKETVIK